MTTYTTQQFNESRQFGIEIEFKGNRDAVVAKLHQLGINVSVVGYTHEVVGYWKMTTDASAEWELVSPILKGRDGLNQVKLVCQALVAGGAKIDKTCGFHVHHDVNDYNVADFKSLFALYTKVEAVLDTFLPESRRANNNRYCRSLSIFGRDGWNYQDSDVAPIVSEKKELLKKIQSAHTLSTLSRIFRSNRYVKLNYQSYMKYGTIEFRQHSGTVEWEKMYNWILLTQQMVNLSKERHVSYQYNPVYWDTMGYFTEVLRMTTKYGANAELASVMDYYKGRAKQLKKTEATI